MNNPQKDKTSSPQRHGQTQSQQTQVGSNEQDNLQQFSILLTPAYAAFSQIIDGLFLTGVGGMTFDNFRKNKITNIINCTREAPNWRLPGVECFRIAVDDSPTEDLLSHLDSGTDKIYSILSNGGRAVVHCVAGVSRSASVVIAYLIKYKKMNLRDAYNHVQSRRRVVRPNNGFFKQLIAFEKKILGSNSVKMVTLRRDDVQIEIPDFFEKEHKRFVILETLKVKAASLRTAQSTTPATMAASTSANSNPIVTNESSTPQNSAQSSKESSTINSSSKLSSEEEKKLTDSSLDHISKE